MAIRTRRGFVRLACEAGRKCEHYTLLAADKTLDPESARIFREMAESFSILAFRHALMAASMPLRAPTPRKPRNA